MKLYKLILIGNYFQTLYLLKFNYDKYIHQKLHFILLLMIIFIDLFYKLKRFFKLFYHYNYDVLFKTFKQLLNKSNLYIILLVFHLNISGNDINEIHPLNKEFILVTL